MDRASYKRGYAAGYMAGRRFGSTEKKLKGPASSEPVKENMSLKALNEKVKLGLIKKPEVEPPPAPVAAKQVFEAPAPIQPMKEQDDDEPTFSRSVDWEALQDALPKKEMKRFAKHKFTEDEDEDGSYIIDIDWKKRDGEWYVRPDNGKYVLIDTRDMGGVFDEVLDGAWEDGDYRP